jgi:hypothetical protein
MRFFCKKNRNKFPFNAENQYICTPKYIKRIKYYNNKHIKRND